MKRFNFGEIEMKNIVGLMAMMGVFGMVKAVSNPYVYSCTLPSPFPSYCNTSLPLLDRAAAVASALSSAQLMDRMSSHGPTPALPELNLAPVCANGPEAVHGVSSVCVKNAGGELVCPTIFPSPPHLAATFNSSDLRLWAGIVGMEQRVLVNVNGTRKNLTPIGVVARAPVLNLAAHPLWGRNHNGPSEDRVLVGAFGEHGVRGLQEGPVGFETGGYVVVASELKHFAAYQVESNPGSRFSFIDQVHPFDMADTYLPAFEHAISDSNPLGYMCSYPAANVSGSGEGPVPFCASSTFSTLARSWGFGGGGFDGPAGYIESDCGALGNIATQHHYVSTLPEAATVALKDGHVDMNCGNIYCSGKCPLAQALAAGNVTRAELEQTMIRSTSTLMMAGAFDTPYSAQPLSNLTVDNAFGTAQSAAISRAMARRGYVLLQDDSSILPTALKGRSVALIGPWSNLTALPGDYFGDACADGTLNCVQTIAGAVSKRTTSLSTIPACSDITCNTVPGMAQATAAAASADVVILAVGDSLDIDHEGHDRSDINFPGQQTALIQAVLAATPPSTPVIAIMITGEVIDLTVFTNTTAAVLAGFYPGVEAAQALADVLEGMDEDGNMLDDLLGRSPITWMPADAVVDPGNFHVTPHEAPYAGLGLTYRWFVGDVTYPFASGLSYSNFTINGTVELTINPTSQEPLKGSDTVADATVVVTNTGTRDAAEVITLFSEAMPGIVPDGLDHSPTQPTRTLHQVFGDKVRSSLRDHPYRQCPDHAPLPSPSLVGFARVVVPAGQSRTVSIPIQARALALTDCTGARLLRKGTYQITHTLSPTTSESTAAPMATLEIPTTRSSGFNYGESITP